MYGTVGLRVKNFSYECKLERWEVFFRDVFEPSARRLRDFVKKNILKSPQQTADQSDQMETTCVEMNSFNSRSQ
jgi:hypothetical protein